MLNPTITKNLNYISALLVGISIPSLMYGRAIIGITLGLAFILVLIAGNHRETLNILKPFFKHYLTYIIVFAFLALSLNIPFSLDISLSFEAWLRTWVICGAIFYLISALRNHIELIGNVIIIALVSTLLVTVFGFIEPNKPAINGYILLLPLLGYFSFKNKENGRILVGIIGLVVFVVLAVFIQAKASIAGALLIGLSLLFFFGAARYQFKYVLMTLFIVAALAFAGLFLWLPDNMNDSSSYFAELAPFPVWLIDFHRQLIWIFSFDLFQESPWVGFGLNASNYHPLGQTSVGDYFSDQYSDLGFFAKALVLPGHPHNWMIELLLDGGLIGLIPSVLAVSAIFLCSIFHYLRSRSFPLLMIVAISAGYWGTGLLNFSYWSVWWQTVYFLTCAICFVLYLHDTETKS